jgi:NADH:ubiquinone oxidoreductase subunit 6 (subunit J)
LEKFEDRRSKIENEMTALAVIAAFTLASAAFAITRRDLIHAALLLIFTWAGIAAFYLWAGAEFIAFGQVLIYVGAVSMVVLFAVLLTRRTRADAPIEPSSHRRAFAAVLAGGLVFGLLAYAVFGARFALPPANAPSLAVAQLGRELMGTHAASLLIAGVILTVALIGATIIAATESDREDRS